MRQRVALARTLLHDPAGADPRRTGQRPRPPGADRDAAAAARSGRAGKTLIVTSHILPELARICDRVAIIIRGRLRAFGTLDEVARQLSPLRTMEVLLTRAAEVEPAAAVIRQHAEPGAEVSPAPAELSVRFRTALDDAWLARLLARLTAADLGVVQFREVQTDLEEAFMTATREGEARPATAERPGSCDVSPIVRRELLGLLRTRAAAASLVGCAAVTAALVVVHWPAAGVADLGGVAALGVLRGLGYALMAGLLLVLPAFPAAAIVRERVRGTLALLLNSPIPPSAIYIGKLGGVLGFTCVLLLMTLPGAAAGYALGGSATSGGVWLLYAVLLLAALQVSTIGLFVSGRTLRIDAAPAGHLPRGAGGLGTAAGRPLARVAGLPGGRSVRVMAGVPLARACPHGGCGPRWRGSERRGIRQWGRGAVRLRGPRRQLLAGDGDNTQPITARPLDRPRPAGVMTQDRSTTGQVLRRLLFLIDPNRRSGASLLVNPVLVKELRTRRFGAATG